MRRRCATSRFGLIQLVQASRTVAEGSGEQSQAATSINQVALHAESGRERASHSGEVSDNGIAVINEAIEGMRRITQTVGFSRIARFPT